MRVLNNLPRAVSPTPGTDRTHAPSSTGGGMPPDLLQDIRKIPTFFKDYKTAW